LAWAKVKQKL